MKCWQVVCDRLVVHPRGSSIICGPLELQKLGLALAGRATWLECRLNLPMQVTVNIFRMGLKYFVVNVIEK